MINNLLLCTDVYKMGHMEQYPEGTTKVYSYLTARSDKTLGETVFFGLQYYLMEYFRRPITVENVDEFLQYRLDILNIAPTVNSSKLYALARLGYIPLEIKAVPEGTVMPVKNVLLTVTNTHPDFAWVVGFFESLLLKIWNTITVASYSRKLKQLMIDFADRTCDDRSMVPYQVHDFGYRGVSSEETAMLSGASHLVNFFGSDTILGHHMLRKYYDGKPPIALSVPATEHSVMCAYGQDCEFEAFERMLDLYPTGIVSIVSDTYNLWKVLTNFAPRLKEKILAREGKVVFRPDSGDPVKIICGDVHQVTGSSERLGALRLLDSVFGSTVNSKGYSVLNPKVGLIYGDGMYYDRIYEMYDMMEFYKYASSNLVIGVGGLLLQQRSRDEMGFAIKATYAEVNGEVRELFKNPITDPGKRSLKGLMALDLDDDGEYVTKDQLTWEEERKGMLIPVFCDGKILQHYTLEEVRLNAEIYTDVTYG